jgi:ferrous iron transport protein B
VEKKSGSFRYGDILFEVVDLPGTYSLSAFTPEEVITRDYLLNARPDVVVNVVDAGNLERNLYLTVQLLELEVPLLLVLNQMDMARSQGLHIDQTKLAALLGGVPVVETVGNREQGIQRLLATLAALLADRPAPTAALHTQEDKVLA